MGLIRNISDENKRFLRNVMTLVLPMALQNLINVGVSAADVIMLGKVGATTLSAASLAGQVQWIMMLIYFGIASGAAVLIAQYWGKRDIDTIERVLGIAVRLSILVGLFFSVITILMPRQLMQIFTNEEAVIEQGVKYLRIIVFTYMTTSFSVMYLNLIRSVERVIVSTVVYSISLSINIIMNYILIFGKFGAPKLGIQGAAIGTLIARGVELIIVIIYAYKVNKEVRFKIKNLFKRDKVLFKDFMKYAAPVMFNELMWGAGYSANAAIIGRLGSNVVAANSVAHVTRQLSMVIGFGVASAAAIMIGKVIGEARNDLAEAYGRKFVKLGIATGLIGAVVILLAMPVMNATMALGPETEFYMKVFMSIMAYYVICQSLNSTWVVGIFRAGGDTKFGLVLDVATMWGGSILFGALAAFVFKWSIPVVYMILMCDEILKIPLCFHRYKSKKWLNNVTR